MVTRRMPGCRDDGWNRRRKMRRSRRRRRGKGRALLLTGASSGSQMDRTNVTFHVVFKE